MLVLSRQKDESIMIGDDVEITIVDVRGDKVRLGITAPKSIPVHRREIYDAIQRENAQKEGEVHAGGNNEPAGKAEDAVRLSRASGSNDKKTDKPEKAQQK
jgi:carbon storage regulator